jgi:eukaryotic-like serine/threonine-protein kinase
MDDGEGDPLAVSEGDLVDGKYRVGRLLGQGGMGYVMKAEHEQLGHPVALKFLATALVRNKTAVTRFLREGRAAVRLGSEHVARVLDVGTLASGVPYLAMEFLEGLDLGQLVMARGSIRAEDAVDYVLQACDAVAEAHALGIVHRDLKPANLFLTHRRDGSPFVKVLDFGISKALEEGAGPSMTATSTVMGSPFYMSPEQIRSSKHVDARTDIWALGTILYELLSGRPPYMGESMLAVCAAIASEPVPSLADSRPDLAPGLAATVMHCLEKDTAKRYQTVAELGVALLPFGPKWAPVLVERWLKLLQPGTPPSWSPGAQTWDGEQQQSTPPPAAAADLAGPPAAPAVESRVTAATAVSGEHPAPALPPAAPMPAVAAPLSPHVALAPPVTAGAWSDDGRITSASKPRGRGALWAVLGAAGLLTIGAAGLVVRMVILPPRGADSGAPATTGDPAATSAPTSATTRADDTAVEPPAASGSSARAVDAAARPTEDGRAAATAPRAGASASSSATATPRVTPSAAVAPGTKGPALPKYGGREY